MTAQRIQLDDLIAGVVPYEPKLMRRPITPADLLPEATLTHAAAKTAKDILKREGISEVTVTDQDALAAEQMFTNHISKVPNAITREQLEKPEIVLKLESLVTTYDWRVIQHADQIRLLVTNKLLELSDHRDAKVQLKAVELLGKLADVGMFVEKQEITYKQKSDEELKQQLWEKLGLIIEGEVIEETKPKTAQPKTQTNAIKEAPDGDTMPLPDVPVTTTNTIDSFFDATGI